MDNFTHMIQSQDMSEKLSEFKKDTWFAHGCYRDFYFDLWNVKTSLESRKIITFLFLQPSENLSPQQRLHLCSI